MTQSKPSEEVTMRELIEKVFEDDHEGHVWWDAFKYTDCKVNIISDLEALFQQKLEDQRNEMERTVKELESALEGVNHELLNNLMESYCEHGKKHKEGCQSCGRGVLETLGGRK